ncbi:MAG: alpha/beta hydrolase [Chloroflexi bacterium]|nr:alpha/beta hydrolase [Chloroflexota bacterium]
MPGKCSKRSRTRSRTSSRSSWLPSLRRARNNHPLISPLFADLHGLPPTLIQVGNDEILLSDSTRLEEKMKALGMDARLEVWDGMWHVFQVFAPWVPESGQAIQNIGRFVSERIQP